MKRVAAVIAAIILLAACSPIRSEVQPFFDCVKHHESQGDYTVVSPDGLYHGAFQFDQETWDSAAQLAGRLDLVGVPSEQASVWDQDLLAQTLYDERGAQPWNGSGCG